MELACRDHPRLRGEYPLTIRYDNGVEGSPPLARGIQQQIAAFLASCRITPACAGNTNHPPRMELACRDHPRLRGEYFDVQRCGNVNIGSPPLARGIQLFIDPLRKLYRITPACAGNTSSRRSKRSMTSDHPRLRGEYCRKRYRKSYGLGSPPLARGIPRSMGM